MICMEDIAFPPRWAINDQEQTINGWCWNCVMLMHSNHYQRWKKGIEEADCAAALKRAIGKGPPRTIADAIEGLCQPLVKGDVGEIRCEGRAPISGKLEGAMIDSDEQRWKELKKAFVE